MRSLFATAMLFVSSPSLAVTIELQGRITETSDDGVVSEAAVDDSVVLWFKYDQSLPDENPASGIGSFGGSGGVAEGSIKLGDSTFSTPSNGLGTFSLVESAGDPAVDSFGYATVVDTGSALLPLGILEIGFVFPTGTISANQLPSPDLLDSALPGGFSLFATSEVVGTIPQQPGLEYLGILESLRVVPEPNLCTLFGLIMALGAASRLRVEAARYPQG